MIRSPEGRAALVTGSLSGIGPGIARGLAADNITGASLPADGGWTAQ